VVDGKQRLGLALGLASLKHYERKAASIQAFSLAERQFDLLRGPLHRGP
jgi:hypothetical protein